MTKATYQKPTIIRHQGGLSQKFGRPTRRASMERIDGVPVEELMEKYGSPLFVFSERTIRERYRQAHRAFSIRYPKVQFAWSYKTNYIDAICRIYHQEGSWAEVVSDMEYDMARRLGVPGNQILFNGPLKTEEALRRAFKEGAHVHIDHYDELYMAEQVAKEFDEPVPVAIRVNMDTGIYPRWDRFGFNLDAGEAFNAVMRMHSGGKLKIAGLHSHIGTFILDPQAYGRAASKLAELAKRIKRETGEVISYIDLGGGLPSRSTLHEQYAPGTDSTPPIDDYAAAICDALLGAGFPTDELPTLFIESGRALIDDAGTMITRVVGNKRLADGRRAVIVDAGVNTLFTSFWYRHDILPVHDKGGMPEDTVIYGPLCMNIDVVRPSVSLPPLSAGDALVIRPVGAYNVTQWMQFIRLRPPVVLIGEQGEVDVIRRAECVDDIKGPEQLPERFVEKRHVRVVG